MNIEYKPFLFYVVFGVSGEQLQVSRSRHYVDSFPKSLEIRSLSKANHTEYINGFFEGDWGNILRKENRDLYEKCRSTENCVIIKGYIDDNSNLAYMRNVIGIVQAFMEQGAAGVLDLLTFSMFSPQDWKERFFEKEINAQNHVVILVSEEQDKYWLHTRGMAKFGRPDFSVHNVDKNQIGEYKEILDQMILQSSQGVFFSGEFKINTRHGNTYKVLSRFVDNFDNDDFNNAYCDINIVFV